MATILPFVIPHPARAAKPAPDRMATIVIFPGVRYERRQEVAAPKPATAGRSSRGRPASPR